MSDQITDEFAINVVNAKVMYGKEVIVNNYCMNVPRACIYALLGPSGCGKTTILNCIIGKKKLDSGDVFVLGGKPGTPGIGIPGPCLGYMPQDASLVLEFTVKYTILFFGRIVGMKDERICERFKILQELLDLPPSDRLIKHCSGGQQRRVSLAVALIHKPELMILDEPTVGLDPELRSIIWDYLVKIVAEEGTTVIITTHYIEEARQAHKIGLMRDGKVLAEESPARLMELCNTDNLQEVFLNLSNAQTGRQFSEIPTARYTLQTTNEIECTGRSSYYSTSDKAKNLQYNFGSLNKFRLKSMFWKNVKQLFGNPSLLFTTFFLPVFEILCFFYCIGGDPRNISIAVVNDEVPNCGTSVAHSYSSCNFTNLSCRFIANVQDSMIDIQFYDNFDDAMNDVQRGNVLGVIYFAKNYSDALSNRVNNFSHISHDDLDLSEIKVWLDMSNMQIGELVERRLLKRFQAFYIALFTDCHYSEKMGKVVPMQFNFEYGTEYETVFNFMVPGILLSIMFILGSVTTSTTLILERTDGIWDRLYVVGVTSLEIYISHFSTQIFIVFLQTAEVIFMTFIICGIEYSGELWVTFLLTLFQGICGMSFGFLISVMVPNYVMANIAIAGIFLPLLCVSGLIWPLEAQADSLRYFSLSLPFTLSTISFRQLLKKGAGICNLLVLSGFGVVTMWIIFLTALSIVLLKYY